MDITWTVCEVRGLWSRAESDWKIGVFKYFYVDD